MSADHTSATSLPPSHPHATPGERIAMWIDLMAATEEMQRAGMRQRIGPHGDVSGEFRRWYERELQHRPAQRYGGDRERR